MNPREQLNGYFREVESRLRLAAAARGIGVAGVTALAATLATVAVANGFSFSDASVQAARFVLFLAVALAAGLGLAVPLLALNRRVAARRAEREYPQFEERLLTLAERRDAGDDRFLELLAADTVEVARRADLRGMVAKGSVLASVLAGGGALGLLLWLGIAGPGFVGYGTALLWAGTPRAGAGPLYALRVTPGDAVVRRKGEQVVTASPSGFQPSQVRLFARFHSTTKWEEAPMQPQAQGTGYEFLFASIPEAVDYYVQAGSLRSKTYTVSVVDLPAVKRLRVTYRFPAWTGLKDAVEEDGGDLRAVEGTEATVAVETDRPLEKGVFILDDGRQIALAALDGNRAEARVRIEKDGVYHVAALEQGRPVRLSEDYFIEAKRESAPSVKIPRPGRDIRVNPIEEVTVAVEARDDFGLREVRLHYSVNGGDEQVVPIPAGQRETAEGSATIALEDFKLVPGDIVSFYATARDARRTSRTDMFFIEAQPFEKEYSQSQQMDGGGEGGGQQDENQISQRQKEIIAATWNQIRDQSGNRQSAAENARFLSEVQAKLRDQARSLAARMGRRELSASNEEFNSFSKDMELAAQAMETAAGKLKGMGWKEALPAEQKALQHLLRAEAMFRQIRVAFGSRGGRGQGGGAGRDLENLFDLELDRDKNQYETGRQQASADRRANEIDEAMQKLEQLARRQQELARQQQAQRQNSQQRWQQEMLRREAEELQRRMEQLTREGESGEQSAAGQERASAGGRAGSGSQQDQRLRQALERLQQATDGMRRAGAPQGASEAETRRAAEQLEQARELLGGMRRQESAERMNDLARRAEGLAAEQRKFAEAVQKAYGQGQPGQAPDRKQAQELGEQKAAMADELERLERDMQAGVREMAASQKSASSRLREALGEVQQGELRRQMRTSAEWIRRGLGSYAWMREAPQTAGVERLRDQVREAQSRLGTEQGGQQSGAQGGAERALAGIERLRNQLAGQDGRERGYGAVNRGDLRAPDVLREPGGMERAYREGIRELAAIGQSKEDPEMAREALSLIREMRKLDPKAFPGNPELVERLRSQVLPGLDRIELQLRRKVDESQGMARSGASDPPPSGYAEAVAEYFRRLSKGGK